MQNCKKAALQQFSPERKKIHVSLMLWCIPVHLKSLIGKVSGDQGLRRWR